MANGSVEENIQFLLEAIDLDEDIEMSYFVTRMWKRTVYCKRRRFQASKLQMKKKLQLVFLQLFLSTKKILLVW